MWNMKWTLDLTQNILCSLVTFYIMHLLEAIKCWLGHRCTHTYTHKHKPLQTLMSWGHIHRNTISTICWLHPSVHLVSPYSQCTLLPLGWLCTTRHTHAHSLRWHLTWGTQRDEVCWYGVSVTGNECFLKRQSWAKRKKKSIKSP